MAALLAARNQDTLHNDSKILLSSFANGGLHVDKVKGFLKSERVRTKKVKNGKKKQPQRGLGVAQLEKLRLIEEHNKRETAVRLAILQGQATHVLHPLRPISAYQNNRSSCTAPLHQQSGLLKGFPPQHYQVFEGLGSSRNGMHQIESFSLAPESAPLTFGQQPSAGMILELGLSPQTLSAHQRKQTSLTPLPTVNVWDAKSPVSTDCTAYNYRMPLCREPAAEEEPIDTRHQRCRSELACIPLKYRSESVDTLPQQRRCSIHAPLKQQLCVPSPGDRTGELSSFQSNMKDYTVSSMKDEVIQLKRRSCAIVHEQLGDVLMIASRNDDTHPRKAYLHLKEYEKARTSSFHDFLATDLSTRLATVHDSDKEFLTLGLASHSVQGSNASHDRPCLSSNKMEDAHTGHPPDMNFLAKLVGSDFRGSECGSSVVHFTFATDDEILICSSNCPNIAGGSIDLTLKL